MADKCIKIGNKYVPIVETITINSAPVPITASTAAFTNDDNYLWSHGVEVVTEHAKPFVSPPNVSDLVTWCSMTGGRTGIHDISGEIITSVYSAPPPSYFTSDLQYKADITVVNDGLQLQAVSTILNTTTGATIPHIDQVKISKLVALRFKFSGATTPAESVYGYRLMIVERRDRLDDRVDPPEHVYTYSHIANPLIPINLPYYNKTHNTELYYDEVDAPDENPPFDPSGPDPYTPTVDDTSDIVSVPTDPIIGLTDVGFINVYHTSTGALVNLGQYIFPDPQALSATDVLTAIIKFCQTLADVNLINYVIDCHIIPYTPHTSGSSTIKVGYRDTGISAAVVDQDYVTVACGSINLAEYFHGFQDYALTTSKLYLPFLGFVDCKPEWWQGGTLTVDYKFNVIDGSFMVYLRATSSKSALASSVVAQFSGNACYHIPITGTSYAQLAAGYVGAVAGIAQSTGSVASALGSASSALNTIGSGKQVQQSNSYSASSAMMGIRKPYLMIERPSPAYPSNYGHDKAYPTNMTTYLSNVSGYTIIENIDLSGIPFTESELKELRQLLSEGVYF